MTWDFFDNVNTLLSFFPRMPTPKMYPAVVSTSKHLVVAGGTTRLSVEVLNIETLQWSIASSLPLSFGSPQMVLCDGHFYLSDLSGHRMLICSAEDLLKSCKPACCLHC